MERGIFGERHIDVDGLRIPTSTYRLQLNADFGFRQAAALVPYLERLGITDCYTSPILRAFPGSQHGYDICRHDLLNPELGSEEDFDNFARSLSSRQMGYLLDFVPNHMAAEATFNPWWWDILENGQASPYARFFDVDWDPIKPELKGRILIPILGDQYGIVLERGELKVEFEDGLFLLNYYEHRFPLNPRSFPLILRHDIHRLEDASGEESPALRELLSIITGLDKLPKISECQQERVSERQREKEVCRERLRRLWEEEDVVRSHVERCVEFVNGQPGRPESFDPLHQVLEMQVYRLAYWRTAFHEINYRRFFDINTLAGIRVEEEAVFTAIHALVAKLIKERKVTGLRLDHIDGLYNPRSYLIDLQKLIANSLAKDGEEVRRVEAWLDAGRPDSSLNLPFYVVVEKILSDNEPLDEHWPIFGTSGYDFLNQLNGLFVESRNALAMKRLYWRFSGTGKPFSLVTYESKKTIMSTSMASELNVLVSALNRISEENRRTRDFTLESLRGAMTEVAAAFPVYRTYINGAGWSEGDRSAIETAISQARRRNTSLEASIFAFVESVLFSVAPVPHPNSMALPARDETQFRRHRNFTMKFQQYTSPLHAKGVEDTAFYRYNNLLSLNEVGGNPDRFGRSVGEFHEANIERLRNGRPGLLTTATHDTKRGEDARARINVLSEMPDEWRKQVFVWSRLNSRFRIEFEGEMAPSRNDEYLYYQALIGAWPADAIDEAQTPPGFAGRMKGYMLKAIREAKEHTSWINVRPDYEQGVGHYVEKSLEGPKSQKFLAASREFRKKVARLGAYNSLAQLVLKLGVPGTPDFYQGAELWDLSLVDPDNRRPVDYDLRQRLLSEMEPVLNGSTPADKIAFARTAIEQWHDGRVKMFVTASGLRCRRANSELFLHGDYLPVKSIGERAEHVVAFGRFGGDCAALIVVPRFTSLLPGVSAGRAPAGEECWGATRLVVPRELAGRSFVNVFTGERFELGAEALLGSVLREFPVALLIGK